MYVMAFYRANVNSKFGPLTRYIHFAPGRGVISPNIQAGDLGIEDFDRMIRERERERVHIVYHNINILSPSHAR